MDFKNQYLMWLNENIEQYKIDTNTFRITFPFLDRNNDFVEFYIEKLSSNKYILTDDGATLNELEFSGINIKTNNRKKLIENVINSYGIQKNQKNELFVECILDEIPLKKHLLAQCMIKLSDLFNIPKENIKSLFLEDVKNLLTQNDIRYIENATFYGKSSLPTTYDFIVPSSHKMPERLIKVINNLNPQYAKSTLFEWEDVKETRPNNSILYTFVNTISNKNDSLNILNNYNVKTFIWNDNNSKQTTIHDLKI